MSPQELHRQQVNAIRASLLLAEDRTERHAIFSLAGEKPCIRCNQPRSRLWCRQCDGSAPLKDAA